MKNKIKIALANKLYKFVMKYTTYFEEPLKIIKKECNVDNISASYIISPEDAEYLYSSYSEIIGTKAKISLAESIAKQLFSSECIEIKQKRLSDKSICCTGTIKVVRGD